MSQIRAIIGLGNPGKKYYHHRHSIGFRVVDALAQIYGGQWRSKDNAETADIMIGDHPIVLIKPQTFMNSSGKVIPALLKKGIKPENILVVHDELEHPFSKITMRTGGSHRGHNGLRSIIGVCGADFMRLRFGIGRPEQKEEVPEYVLRNFSESDIQVEELIAQAIEKIESAVSS